MHGWQAGVKHLCDFIVSAIALVCLAPVFLVIGLAIRLDSPGPVFFRQARLGRLGVPFLCYKFRTMFVNAADLRNPDGSTYNAGDDPRVTRMGRFLRKTSLDELPQLINVVRGEMSLIGPRPDVVDALSLYIDRDHVRLQARPGMTGWAVVHGRNRVPLRQRRALDIEYVENYSLWLDLQIILRTLPYVLLGAGVYTPPAETPETTTPETKA